MSSLMALSSDEMVPLQVALQRIAARAESLDRNPEFPAASIADLAAAGALRPEAPGTTSAAGLRAQWDLVRSVAAADSSVGRIFDGHLNALERLTVAADPDVARPELEAAADRGKLFGVWGADPGPGEGPPARISKDGGTRTLEGVKTFCSGAGGVDAALVMVGSDDGVAPSLVLVDGSNGVEVDTSWFQASGMRASESHRVVFTGAPVLAILGEPGELGKDPWFSLDAMRTAASWMGMADAAAEAALDSLAERRADEPVSQLAAGRIEAARGTLDAWLAHGAHAAEAGHPLRALGVQMRVEAERAIRTILGEAARACGSAPFVAGARLDRARRDLEMFLLQHRLDPLMTRVGAQILEDR